MDVFKMLTLLFAFGAVITVEGLHLLGTEVQPCGVEASPSLIHHNPWLVLLEYYRRGAMVDIRCGGTLISKRHVITAAHCVKIKANMYKVRLGEYDLRTEEDCMQGACSVAKSIEVVDIAVHPDYDGSSHDIAILTLGSDAPYTDFIRPICLPTTAPKNATFTAAGWGEIPRIFEYSEVKKIIPLPQWEPEDCQNAYRNTKLPQDVICAGGEEGVDSCRGDSGGPLVEYKERAELAGLTSKGFTVCGTAGKPGIYTSVLTYLEWITDVMDKI